MPFSKKHNKRFTSGWRRINKSATPSRTTHGWTECMAGWTKAWLQHCVFSGFCGGRVNIFVPMERHRDESIHDLCIIRLCLTNWVHMVSCGFVCCLPPWLHLAESCYCQTERFQMSLIPGCRKKSMLSVLTIHFWVYPILTHTDIIGI